MTGILASVNQRTRLVGENRLELLLFRLGGSQLYGINVFKVKEVLRCPSLHAIPHSNPVVKGVAHIRGRTVSILDLNLATGQAPLQDQQHSFVIVTEYNRSIQGFLVSAVDRIVNLNWKNIHPPPVATGAGAHGGQCLTAVTEVEGSLVQIIDVEKILAEVAMVDEQVSETELIPAVAGQAGSRHLLIVDDSAVARKQIQGVVQAMGLTATVCRDGREALAFLQAMLAAGKNPCKELMLVISDIEMPEMDGYTFTSEVRAEPQLQDLHIILHTSLSGGFNETMVKKVGADDFLAKFQPHELAQRVNARMLSLTAGTAPDAAAQ